MAAHALVGVAFRAPHSPHYHFPGARRLAQLVVVDEHMDREPRFDEWQRFAHAPPRRQATSHATGSTGEYDASSHNSSSIFLGPLDSHGLHRISLAVTYGGWCRVALDGVPFKRGRPSVHAP